VREAAVAILALGDSRSIHPIQISGLARKAGSEDPEGSGIDLAVQLHCVELKLPLQYLPRQREMTRVTGSCLTVAIAQGFIRGLGHAALRLEAEMRSGLSLGAGLL